jgi:hypothetical protein
MKVRIFTMALWRQQHMDKTHMAVMKSYEAEFNECKIADEIITGDRLDEEFHSDATPVINLSAML